MEAALKCIMLARQLTARELYYEAYDVYMKTFEQFDELKSSLEPEFLNAIGRMNEILVSTNKLEEIFHNFARTLALFPNSPYFINELGKYLYKYGFYNEARYHFEEALNLNSQYVNAEKNLNSIKNFHIERWHFRMLNDKIRNESYRAAIHQLIIPFRDSVLDIGTGTGLLTMYASECKPRLTTSCDSSEIMSKMADTITQEHGFDDVLVINNLSTMLNDKDIEGKKTLLITELFDAGLFGEHVLEALSHAWDHLLVDEARVIPNKVEFFVMGANCEFLNQKYQLCIAIKELLNVSALNVHVLTEDTYDSEDVHLYGNDIKYMTEPISLVTVDFNNPLEIKQVLEQTEPYAIELLAAEDGEVNIYIGWFNVYLSDKYTLTTDPRAKFRANAWQQAVFFDNIPKQVKEKNTLYINFLMNGGKLQLLPEYDYSIDRISPEILRFLNDTEYMEVITGQIGQISFHLEELVEMSQADVIDLCPFPIFGLQLLKQGIRSLVCFAKTDEDKHFFVKVFQANNISLSKITILVTEFRTTEFCGDDKYHAIFCNIFEVCGEIDTSYKEIIQNLKDHYLVEGGILMPSNIKLKGQIVYSNWLDINNRVLNENVSNYNIEKYLRKYQVTQNLCIDLNHLEYTPLSEPINLGTVDSPKGTELISVPIINDGCASGILCWYIIELMEPLNGTSTFRKSSFIDGLAFISYTKTQLYKGQSTLIEHCVDSDGSFKLTLKHV